MVLSRLKLAPSAASRAAYWERLGDAYALHQEVWRLLSAATDQERDFLYRLDLHRGRPKLYTLSSAAPRDPGGLWSIESKPFQPALARGDRLLFALRANPTVKRDGKRHDVVMDAKTRLRAETEDRSQHPTQAELVAAEGARWLERKAEQLGVQLESVVADGYQVQRFVRPSRAPSGRPSRPIVVATCELEGQLRIEDPERFVAGVQRGVGPAKSFGCGLMLLRRSP